MREFLKRLGESILKILGLIIGFIVIGGIMFAFVGLVFWLPIWLLSFIIGDYSYIWMLLVFITMPIIGEWNKIKTWFLWQFVEKFRK